MATPEIKLYEQSEKLIAAYTLNAQSKAAKISTLKECIKESEFYGFYILEDGVRMLVDLVNEKIVKNDYAKPIEYTVAERRDAQLKSTLSETKMLATLELTTPYAGKQPSLNTVIKHLQADNILMGVDKTAIADLLSQAAEAEGGETFKAEVAFGQAPKNGRDTWFESLVVPVSERALKPQEDEHGKVDMRDLGQKISVSKGDPLVRRHPPTKGRAGYNVLGEPVAAVAGKALEFEVGKGSMVAPNDKNLLVAERDGLPFILKKGARVDDVMEIGSVDVSTGHIDFNGGVIVHGDVTEGMRLHAQGNVTVTGFIDNADVQVAGDLVVLQGIVGRQTGDEKITRESVFHCNVHAKGNVTAKYLQYSSVECQGTLNFTAHLSHARVVAKAIQGGDPKLPLGKIIGGLFEVEEYVSCATIGAPAAKSIYIYLATQLKKYKADLEKLMEVKNQKIAILSEVQSTWDHLKSLPKCANRSAMIKKTLECYKRHDKDYKIAKQAAQKVRAKIDRATHVAHVAVRREVFSNVHFYCDETNFTSKENLPAGQLKLNNQHNFVYQAG